VRVHAAALLCDGGADPERSKALIARANPGYVVQAVKATAARNEALVEMLAAQTLRAQSSERLLAKKPEIDLLLRFAGTSQIAKAIRGEGAKAGVPFVLVAAGPRPVKGLAGLKGTRLRREPLARSELAKIEKAALLDAIRG